MLGAHAAGSGRALLRSRPPTVSRPRPGEPIGTELTGERGIRHHQRTLVMMSFSSCLRMSTFSPLQLRVN